MKIDKKVSEEMVSIECTRCEKNIEIPKYIDTNSYDGDLLCKECKSLLYIKYEGNILKKRKLTDKGSYEDYKKALMDILHERAKLVEKEAKRIQKDFNEGKLNLDKGS